MLAESSKQEAKFKQWAEIANTGFNAVRDQTHIIEANLSKGHDASAALSESNKDLAAALERFGASLRKYSNPGVARRRRLRGMVFWTLFFVAALAFAGLLSVQYFDDPLRLREYWSLLQ
jgi:hypothetical protein